MKRRDMFGVSAVFRYVWLLLILLMALGCSTNLKSPSLAEKANIVSGSEKTEKSERPPTYYDFDDVLIPAELKLDTDKSMVISTSTFSGGVLVFNGYVESSSLIEFFTRNMAKDNWQLKASVKYKHTVLTFEKPRKGCVITIGTGAFNTPVEIWVGVIHEAKTGQMAPLQPRIQN